MFTIATSYRSTAAMLSSSWTSEPRIAQETQGWLHPDHLAVDHAAGGAGDPDDGAVGQAADVVLDQDPGRSGGGEQIGRDGATELLVDTCQQGHRQHAHSRLIENDNQHNVHSEPE